ncbi:MAG: c-type cytochrome [Acidobacteriota bacterium]
MDRNKWLLLVSSIGVLALLVTAAVQENVLREWRQIQTSSAGEDGAIPVMLRQIVNVDLGTADRCVSCHVAMAPGEPSVKGPGLGTHPPVVHDPGEFGCTVCHGGQGRATDKLDAHGRLPFWPEPMLPLRMAEAGCGTCHTAVGVPGRDAFDAAVATFARLDCFACHRVDGRGGTLRPDGGGMEGPDLSRTGLAGYDRGWYERHLQSAAAASSGPWKTAFGSIGDEDRRHLETFLKTRVAAPTLVSAKSTFLSTGCLGCHKVDGVGGDEGPDLTQAGEKDPGRLDYSSVPGAHSLDNWFAEHVRAPAAVVAGSLMPALGLSDDEVEAVTMFTLSLRRRDVPGSYMPRDRMRVARFGEREFASNGGTLFGAFCAGCHGRAGQGHRAPGMAAFPAIANADFLTLASDDLLTQTILRGRPGTRMRAWGEGATGLGPEDAAALVRYLRGVSGAIAPAETRPARWVSGDVRHGERLFASACAGCHGATGGGGEGPALTNPVLLEQATDTFFVETIRRGRRGTTMPGFAKPSTVHRTLSETEIEAIVAFVRSSGGQS